MISPFYHNRKKNIRIHILKTDINTKVAINTIKLLFKSYPGIIKWSVDLEDIDKVLRVETNQTLDKNDIIEQVSAKGIYCEELV